MSAPHEPTPHLQSVSTDKATAAGTAGRPSAPDIAQHVANSRARTDVAGVSESAATFDVADSQNAAGTWARFEVAAEHKYNVVVGNRALGAFGDALRSGDLGHPQKVFLLTQNVVRTHANEIADMCSGAGCEVKTMVVPDGEAGKTLAVAEQAWHRLADWGLGRGDLIVGVGGGAATDLAGFVAAGWLRGVKFVTVATTVAGMVDAAVGGKTAVNIAAGKNLVGAFHSPHLVVCDTTALGTLPEPDIAAGLAEVIKCGFIADPVIIAQITESPEAAFDCHSVVMRDLIERSIRVKADVVTSDFRESGRREILNYGHTFAHAIERCSGYSWRHGDAVSVGMVFVAHLREALARRSERDGLSVADAQALVTEHQRVLTSVGLPVSVSQYLWDDLHDAMLRDKKVRRGVLRFVVLDGVARPEVHAAPSAAALTEAFNATARL